MERLPRRLVVFGIESTRFDTGGAPDPVVLAAVEPVARRVIEDATTLGTGSTPQADALYVIDSGSWVRPSTGPEWIPWPPPGFVPNVHIYPRFSLSHPSAGFGDATVSVTIDGGAVSAPVVSRTSGLGRMAVYAPP